MVMTMLMMMTMIMLMLMLLAMILMMAVAAQAVSAVEWEESGGAAYPVLDQSWPAWIPVPCVSRGSVEPATPG
eukprot:6205253-Karenia_brevis.AAC.1